MKENNERVKRKYRNTVNIIHVWLNFNKVEVLTVENNVFHYKR